MTGEDEKPSPMQRQILAALAAAGERGLSSAEIAEVVDIGLGRGGEPMSNFTVHQHISRLRHHHEVSIELIHNYRLGRFSRPHPIVVAHRQKGGPDGKE